MQIYKYKLIPHTWRMKYLCNVLHRIKEVESHSIHIIYMTMCWCNVINEILKLESQSTHYTCISLCNEMKVYNPFYIYLVQSMWPPKMGGLLTREVTGFWGYRFNPWSLNCFVNWSLFYLWCERCSILTFMKRSQTEKHKKIYKF